MGSASLFTDILCPTSGDTSSRPVTWINSLGFLVVSSALPSSLTSHHYFPDWMAAAASVSATVITRVSGSLRLMFTERT